MYYIYCITNKLNNKTYIGQHKTSNVSDSYMGSGVVINKAFQKYGIENFSKEILAVAETQENIDILERVFIALYRQAGKAEYNIADGGSGRHCSGEFEKRRKQKISKASAEHWNKEGYREKVSKAISKSLTGKKIAVVDGKRTWMEGN